MTDLVTGEAVIVDVPPARFGSRMIAIALDLIIEVVLLFVAFGLLVKSAGGLDTAAVSAIALSASVLVVVGYPVIFETLTRGRSLGKLALGLRVVSENGGPEQFRQALLRALAGVIEIWVLLGSPALICSLISAKGKRLGDVFAGTVVIQERLPSRAGPMVVMPPGLAGWAASLELSGLQDQTAAMARQYLARFHELAPVARQELGN
ncbi:MAG: RDD family protein, partial [Micromonosporaceae bacterium]